MSKLVLFSQIHIAPDYVSPIIVLSDISQLKKVMILILDLEIRRNYGIFKRMASMILGRTG